MLRGQIVSESEFFGVERRFFLPQFLLGIKWSLVGLSLFVVVMIFDKTGFRQSMSEQGAEDTVLLASVFFYLQSLAYTLGSGRLCMLLWFQKRHLSRVRALGIEHQVHKVHLVNKWRIAIEGSWAVITFFTPYLLSFFIY